MREINRIAAVGNYLPRQCGIATFTTDLCEALANRFSDASVIALPMNDTDDGYAYPERVRFELVEQEMASYRRAADFLNINDIDVVTLQHEFGIFGGVAGSHIIGLLSDLRMPVVATLHTVLREPDANQRKVMSELAQLVDRFVVMSERARVFLDEIYHVPLEKVDLIPHGIPDVSFIDPNFYKDKFGVEGKTVLLTFGLLSPNKGIEFAIEALPPILKKHPDVVYIVLGATHPKLKREQGETYRLSLQHLAQEKGVEANVIFHNRFVTLQELIEFIGAADIYITPYLNEAQITSGTLAYSVGAGKPVVSTPYWYAEELLDDDRGTLVPFRDAPAIAKAVLDMLKHETKRHAMRRKAYQLGRDMVWSKVAEGYMASFSRARDERFKKPRGAFVAKTLDKRRVELPPLNLQHLQRMTDDTGMIQHATFSVPNYTEGYTTDDNARALILAVLLEETSERTATEARRLAARYLAFLNYAFNPKTRRFRNAFCYDRHWLEEVGSQDSHGRALWALGTMAGRSKDEGLRGLAMRLFGEAVVTAEQFQHPRAWAFTLIGIHEFLRRFYGDRQAQDLRLDLAERLLAMYKKNSSRDWLWFTNTLTYCNGALPHALMLCGQWLGHDDMSGVALESLEWLLGVQLMGGEHLVPIGSNGFYPKGGERARFDQQPIEAHSMVAACLQAFRMTGEERWYREARRCFDWFLGLNDLRVPLYNARTGGCYDGLSPDRVNQNQGAESTLAFLLSLMEMTLAEHVITEPEPSEAAEPAPKRKKKAK